RQILDFAQTKQQELEKTDLNVLIKRSLNMFSQTRKEVNIHTTYQHSIWKTEVDAGQIEQVLLNLYLNAWQAMATEGDLYVQTQNISFSAHQIRPLGLEPGNYVKISVKDTGTGIRKELHSKIFDPFFTTKPNGKGTGLGLASSYGIIRNHGGLIEVQSEVGKGALFNIYLPAVKSKTEPKSLPDDHHPEETRTIMLVDDEYLITDVGSELLTKLGYQVMTASSGKEAVTLYREHLSRIDLVILDIIMPVMGGRETYARLKSVDPEVKVLLASGYSRDHIVEGLMKDGCNGFIQKPFKLEYLDEQIRHILFP
ncbi:MAG: response regulator, partial [Desulfobacterales bacterium]|nr:response regulator [Desulfobacterales bacterium]